MGGILLISPERTVIDLFTFLFTKHRHRLVTVTSEQQYQDLLRELKASGTTFRTRVNHEPKVTYKTGASPDYPGSVSAMGFNTEFDVFVKKANRTHAEQVWNKVRISS